MADGKSARTRLIDHIAQAGHLHSDAIEHALHTVSRRFTGPEPGAYRFTAGNAAVEPAGATPPHRLLRRHP